MNKTLAEQELRQEIRKAIGWCGPGMRLNKEADRLLEKARACYDDETELYAVKEQLEQTKKERDQALAACAEMRYALLKSQDPPELDEMRSLLLETLHLGSIRVEEHRDWMERRDRVLGVGV